MIHIILYSNNEPYTTTKQLTIKSIPFFTSKKYRIHDYNLEKIKQKPWFTYIEKLPLINNRGRRDGYYNAWKAFITKDVYDEMEDNDILYYVDSSQFFKQGFTQNIDKLCDIVNEKLSIAGSVGYDIKNNSVSCCDKLLVWNVILPNKNNTIHIHKLHVLNSWFLFKKCKENNGFINDWAYFSCYTDNTIKFPLVTYHHTADQSIFNILVIKYNLPVFFSRNVKHDENKNKNLVLQKINTGKNNNYFIYLN
jgi:hypothetical protein